MRRARVTRTLALAALAAAAVASLSACAPEPQATSRATATSAPAVRTPVAYRFSPADGITAKAVAARVAVWNKAHPDIPVTATPVAGDAAAMAAAVTADVSAKGGLCLADLGAAQVPDLRQAGALADVTAAAKTAIAGVSAGAAAMTTVAGVTVGLPRDTAPLVYFYDSAAFTAHGLTVPTTVDALVATARQAAASGVFAAAYTPDAAGTWLVAQAAAAGDRWFTASAGHWSAQTTGAGTTLVASLWQRLLDDRTVLVTQRGGDGFAKALEQGQLIGFIGPASPDAGYLSGLQGGTPAQGAWRVAPLPAFGATAQTGSVGGTALAVVTGCAHPAAALAFAQWYTSDRDWIAAQGLVPAATGAVATPAATAKRFGGQDVAAVFAQANADIAPGFSLMPGFTALAGPMADTATEVAIGQAKVAGVFTTAQTAADAELARRGLG